MYFIKPCFDSKVVPKCLISQQEQDKIVPIGFVNLVLKNGCKYLNLSWTELEGNLSLKKMPQLKYLDLTMCKAEKEVFEDLLSFCYSLQKLSIAYLDISSSMVNSICYQNGKVLKILDLCLCKGLNQTSIQIIVRNCFELREINLGSTNLTEDTIEDLTKNLTQKIEKISLGWERSVKDEHIKTLVQRCWNLSVLNLQCTSITNNSITNIIENLKFTLVELDVTCLNVGYSKLIELKSMPKLRVLNCYRKDVENLKNFLHHLTINEKTITVAGNLSPESGIWEIKAKQIRLF